MENHSSLTRQLKQLCELLKLTYIKQEGEAFLQLAKRQQLPHLDCLVQLLDNEYQGLQERRKQRRLKQAHFPFQKTIDSFDFSKVPQIPEVTLRELLTCDFVAQAEPVIFLGEPGTGKTHLAIALGYAAAGMGYHVRFITLAQLANQLMEAKNAKNLSAVIRRYEKPCVLIVDELGYVPLSKAHAELVFQVLALRHGSCDQPPFAFFLISCPQMHISSVYLDYQI